MKSLTYNSFLTMLILCVVALCLHSCKVETKQNQKSIYLEKKSKFHSKIIRYGKAPQFYDTLVTNDNVLKVEYLSNGIKLQALLVKKNIDYNKRKPVLVYLHGGFTLSEEEILDCEVFTNQGYIVFSPCYRGENGNEGNFELLCGEVDDAKAAINWIAKQPFVDSTKIYVFGHSIGGGISAMLSLENDVPIAKSGSSGGIYDKYFYGWEEIIPYDQSNPKEGEMRVLIENIESMQINHYAFIGIEDLGMYQQKEDFDRISKGTKLKIFYLEGDHFSSLKPSMEKFVELIKNQGSQR